jgi:hypothetical protein
MKYDVTHILTSMKNDVKGPDLEIIPSCPLSGVWSFISLPLNLGFLFYSVRFHFYALYQWVMTKLRHTWMRHLILFLTNILLNWKYSIFLHEKPHTWNMTWHIFWPHWRMTRNLSLGCLRLFRLAPLPVLDPLFLFH